MSNSKLRKYNENILSIGKTSAQAYKDNDAINLSFKDSFSQNLEKNNSWE